MTNRINLCMRTGFLLSMFLFLTGCGPYFPALMMERPSVQASSQDVLTLTGDASKGQALFMGYTHFEHDGPPCMGCHSVGENGILGGGVMGPNLTDVTTSRDQAEILATFSGKAQTLSPVMQPIYGDSPLTAQEQADLLAFLKGSVGQPEPDKEPVLLGISLFGALIGAAALGFIYRGRLRGVRRALVAKAQAENQ